MPLKPRDKLAPFLLPPVLATTIATRSTKNSERGPLQRPPLERGEFAGFQSTFRGTSNLLQHDAPSPEKSKPGGNAKACSLHDVWVAGMYGKARQIPDLKPEGIGRETTDGQVRIVRYVPERFERGQVQRPEMKEEVVQSSILFNDGASLMHPKTRRLAHELTVNSAQGEAALRESLRMRTKLHRTCATNYPHGALGIAESPYGETGGALYHSKELQLSATRSQRRGKAGVTPPSTIGDVLAHVYVDKGAGTR